MSAKSDAIIHLRVPASLKARWVRQAQREGKKLSDWITQRMEQAAHPKVTGIARADVELRCPPHYQMMCGKLAT